MKNSKNNNRGFEQVFEYMGLTCVVWFNDTGFRCGYVSIPEGHKFYGKTDDENIDVVCHGGITFSSRLTSLAGHEKDWFIGFDCGHYGDGIDPSNLSDTRKDLMAIMGGHIWTSKEVANECKKIADQVLDQKHTCQYLTFTPSFTTGDTFWAMYFPGHGKTPVPDELTVGQVRVCYTNSKGRGNPDEMFDNFKPQHSYEETYMCDETGVGSGQVYTLGKNMFATRELAEEAIAKYIEKENE